MCMDMLIGKKTWLTTGSRGTHGHPILNKPIFTRLVYLQNTMEFLWLPKGKWLQTPNFPDLNYVNGGVCCCKNEVHPNIRTSHGPQETPRIFNNGVAQAWNMQCLKPKKCPAHQGWYPIIHYYLGCVGLWSDCKSFKSNQYSGRQSCQTGSFQPTPTLVVSK